MRPYASCKRYFKLKIMDILELNLDFRKWCHPISFDATRPFGKLGFKLIECSCQGVYTSNRDLRVSTCVKIGNGRRNRMEKPKIYLVNLFILASCLKSVIMSWI